MSYYTLAISSSNHDSSICLLKDSTVEVAFSCERINKVKHTQLVKQCDIDIVAQYTKSLDKIVLVNVLTKPDGKTPSTNAFLLSERVDKLLAKISKAGINYKKVVVDNSNHHLYHAASSFYTLDLSEAICIVIDGFGSSQQYTDATFAETTTIFYAKEKFETLHKHLFYKSCTPKMTGWSFSQLREKEQSYNFPVTISSHLDIGKMYGTVTRYIGFYTVDAGKTMGLSAYGRQNNLPPMLVNDTIISNSNLFRYDSQIDELCYPELQHPNLQTKKNMAYNVQRALEKVFVERVKQALAIKDCKNIILSGGCSLNILGNSVVKKAFPDYNIFVEPIGSDAAQSLGAALYHYKLEFPETTFHNLSTLYLGPEYSIVDTKNKLLTLVEQYNNGPNV